jgi:DNA-binding NtrC family response regulator
MSQLLIMEDDRDIASLYSHVLEEKGHKVILAHTAEKCLKIYSKRLYEVRMKNLLSMTHTHSTWLSLITKYLTETDWR